jgi:hypothetical protein
LSPVERLRRRRHHRHGAVDVRVQHDHREHRRGGIGGIDLAASAAVRYPSPPDAGWDEGAVMERDRVVDVVVVGSGGAELVAATTFI